jgi:hypothetical protein
MAALLAFVAEHLWAFRTLVTQTFAFIASRQSWLRAVSRNVACLCAVMAGSLVRPPWSWTINDVILGRPL